MKYIFLFLILFVFIQCDTKNTKNKKAENNFDSVYSKIVNTADSLLENKINVKKYIKLLNGSGKIIPYNNEKAEYESFYNCVYLDNKHMILFYQTDNSESGDNEVTTMHYFDKNGINRIVKFEYRAFNDEDTIIAYKKAYYYDESNKMIKADSCIENKDGLKIDFNTNYHNIDNSLLTRKYKSIKDIPSIFKEHL